MNGVNAAVQRSWNAARPKARFRAASLREARPSNSQLSCVRHRPDGVRTAEPAPDKSRLLARRFRATVVPLVLVWGGAIADRRLRRWRTRRAQAIHAANHAQSLPVMERIKTRVEHEVDTRSVRLAAGLLRLTNGRIAHLWRRQALLLTTRGRRSGRERTVPLQFFPDGADMIVVAANSGLPSPPGWYFNLMANPVARVEVGDRTLQVRADELSREQAAAFWPCVLRSAPDYARYPRRTSRYLPLVRLVPIGPGQTRDERTAGA